MRITRRGFIRGSSALLAAGTGGLGSMLAPGQLLAGMQGGANPAEADPSRHHVLLIALRGGFDCTLSVDPKDATEVGDRIHTGYSAGERIQGSRRLFGPLIGGLERHDDRLCILRGVRSDTTNHPDGLAMLGKGAIRGRSGRIAELLGQTLQGSAPLRVLDMDSLDGQVLFDTAPRPEWSSLRQEIHASQAAALGLGPKAAESLEKTTVRSERLGRFLAEARRDEAEVGAWFKGDLGTHLRLAFQAIRGNWARCVNVATRINWFDSHSDNDRFQQKRQPGFFADLTRFIDQLEAHKVGSGTLLDHTTIAVYSEFGRFPRLNGQQGKDHFPENAWVMLGRGIRGGATVGGTDDRGKGEMVNFLTGEAATVERGGRPLFIDNAFATLVAAAGGDPSHSGYKKDAVLDCALGDQTA